MATAPFTSPAGVASVSVPHKALPFFSQKLLSPLRNLSSLAFRSPPNIDISVPSNRTTPLPIRSLSTSCSLPAVVESGESRRTLKSRLAAGETLYGLFLMSSSPTLAEIAGLAGYDYVVVDVEHGMGGVADALPCLRALAASGTPAILRLPESCPLWAKKALDLGPQGLMFPAIGTPEAAANAVACCRYPPRGVRGAAHTIVRASAYGIDDGYLARCEDELLVMCQVESAAGVAQIEAIAEVEGVDVVQMGPLDLSASMGYLWDPGNRKVRAALREAERRVLAARNVTTAADAAAEGGGVAGGGGTGGARGPYLGGFAMPHDPPAELKARGYHMVSGAVDLGLFRRAVVEDVQMFRNAEAEIGEEDDEGRKPADESYWSE